MVVNSVEFEFHVIFSSIHTHFVSSMEIWLVKKKAPKSTAKVEERKAEKNKGYNSVEESNRVCRGS